MSASPLPKKGSFSKFFTNSSQHKRVPSYKIYKHSQTHTSHQPSPSLTPTPPPPNPLPHTPDSTISHLTDQNRELQKQVNHLKHQILTLQPRSSKIKTPSFDLTEKKTFLETQEKCLNLIDSLFNCLNNIFTNSINQVKLEDLELKLIDDFQNFQKKTKINTSEYVKKVLGWRHRFNDELLSPADSIKVEGKLKKRVVRSVSSIIASSIKVYGICVRDFCVDSKEGLWFKKGEIVEIVNTENGSCEGRIGGRVAVFPKEFVKIV